jgi:iron(III) transport system substrate-binding protein
LKAIEAPAQMMRNISMLFRKIRGIEDAGAFLRRIAALAGLLVLAGCGGKSPEVVIYTSQDEVYAEPIFKDFETETGIRVRAVYDSESVKTVGLVNRLIAESSNPQCDVFWNNEEFRTRQLLAHGVFRETNAWAELGYRSRRMLINADILSPVQSPKSFRDVTNIMWRGKVALAYPMYGTTSTHFLVLRQRWGDEAWQAWCRALVANQPKVVDGNSVAAKLVGRGEAWIGFADSDDIAAEQNNGARVIALPVGDDTLFLANTVAVVRGAPHPAEAEKFFEYLQRKEVSQRLVDVHALEGATLDATTASQGLKVDWDSLLKDLDTATKEMDQIFLR